MTTSRSRTTSRAWRGPEESRWSPSLVRRHRCRLDTCLENNRFCDRKVSPPPGSHNPANLSQNGISDSMSYHLQMALSFETIIFYDRRLCPNFDGRPDPCAPTGCSEASGV